MERGQGGAAGPGRPAGGRRERLGRRSDAAARSPGTHRPRPAAGHRTVCSDKLPLLPLQSAWLLLLFCAAPRAANTCCGCCAHSLGHGDDVDVIEQGEDAGPRNKERAWARARATRRRNTSPTTSARTRPLDLRRATMRPMRTAAKTGAGTSEPAAGQPHASSPNLLGHIAERGGVRWWLRPGKLKRWATKSLLEPKPPGQTYSTILPYHGSCSSDQAVR